MILLLIAFGSAIAAGLPLMLSLAGIAVGFASLHLIGSTTPLSVWSMNFSMMIGLAVGIDYSLFIVSRYREEREDGYDAIDAIANTLSTAGKAVFLSALAVVLSLAAVFVVPVMVFRSMALGHDPLGDRRGARRADPAAGRARRRSATGSWSPRATRTPIAPPRVAGPAGPAWRSATRVARCLAGLALLLLLAAPALGMRLGMPGARVVDEGRSSRDGYEMVVESFGPGAAAPLFVTVPADQAETRGRGWRWATRTWSTPGSPHRPRRPVAPSCASPRRPRSTSAETSDMVGRLRGPVGDAVPDADGRRPGRAEPRPHRGAHRPGTARHRHHHGRGLPPAAGGVPQPHHRRVVDPDEPAQRRRQLRLRHPGVPDTASGRGLIGIEHQGFVDAWAPLFFFALLFGLSMDYQLFLLAAIRERYEATGDTQLAIREGIARTGRPITNAALIMIVVFIAFGVTGPIPPTELGITLALAVFLDATVVRMMLVPSLMGLLGDRNWWLPGVAGPHPAEHPLLPLTQRRVGGPSSRRCRVALPPTLRAVNISPDPASDGSPDAVVPPDSQRTRPFRFCVQASHMESPEELRPLARKAEDLGVAVLTVADHLDDQLSPLVALMAAADATTDLRVGSLVFSNDYRHPAMLAKEAATVDRLSGGRLELGLGAGWMLEDYRTTGIPLDTPSVRIERLDESLGIIRSLWAGGEVHHKGTHYTIDGLASAPLPLQRPGPPIWVGGGGRKVLEVAARHADVVHLNPSLRAGVIDHRAGPSSTEAATDAKLGWVRAVAGDRFGDIELGVRIHLAIVTDERDELFAAMAGGFGLTPEEARGTPHALCGTTDQIAHDLVERRDRFGISNIGISASALDDLAPVIAKLAGT